MRSILPDALETRVNIDGRTYRLRSSVFHVLHALDALEDEALTTRDRERLAVWHLFCFPRPRDNRKALDAALHLLLEESPYRHPRTNKRTLDLEQDAAMICAAFYQLYGIDLTRACIRLDWRMFQALLGGITDDTRLGEIMSIRTRDLPKRTAHNGEAIRELQRLKMIYAVCPGKHGSGGQSFEEGLRTMVEILAAMADEPKRGD